MLLVTVLLAVIVLAGFLSMRNKAVPVRAAVAIRTSIASTIATNGTIRPQSNFEAHAPAPATVRRVLVHQGDHVHAGQMLVQLDDAQARADAARAEAQLRAAQAGLTETQAGTANMQAQVAKARAERDAAQRNFEALQRLQQKGAASAEEVQAAQNRLNAANNDLRLLEQRQSEEFARPQSEKVQAQVAEARAALAAAQDLLAHANIRAPRDGLVYSLPLREGQYVNAGDLMVAVASLKQVEVVAYVDEPDIGRLKEGQMVQLTWDAVPARYWHGAVTQVPTTVVQRGTRNVGEITCTIDNQDEKLLPNVNVNVAVVVAQDQNALTLPREAVHQEDNRRFVYQIVDGKLERRDVQTSISNLTRIEITQGLTDNAEVALGSIGNKPLRPGLAVRVVGR